MTQSQQNPTPTDGIKRGSGRAEGFLEILPFLGFLGFAYIFATIATPDRMIWEAPATANNREPLQPQCVASNPSPGVYEWRDCTQEGLKEGKNKFFNTLTHRWE